MSPGLKDTNTLETDERDPGKQGLAILKTLIGKYLKLETVSPELLAVYVTISDTLKDNPESIEARLPSLLETAGDYKSYLESILKRNPQTLLAREKRAFKERVQVDGGTLRELCSSCSELTNSQREALEESKLPLHQVAPELQAWHHAGELCATQRTAHQNSHLYAAVEHYEAKLLQSLPEPQDSLEAMDQVAQLTITRESAQLTADPEPPSRDSHHWQIKKKASGAVSFS